MGQFPPRLHESRWFSHLILKLIFTASSAALKTNLTTKAPKKLFIKIKDSLGAFVPWS
jgi:hypothetical protein